MKLWKLTQAENSWYDTFDALVVAASTEDVARHVTPIGTWENRCCGQWALSPAGVVVEYIGTTDRQFDEGTIIVASFCAG